MDGLNFLEIFLQKAQWQEACIVQQIPQLKIGK